MPNNFKLGLNFCSKRRAGALSGALISFGFFAHRYADSVRDSVLSQPGKIFLNNNGVGFYSTSAVNAVSHDIEKGKPTSRGPG